LGRVRKGAYAELDAVKEEVRAAHRIMSERGWQTIDASYLAVEEIAHEVMRLRNLSGSDLG
jgi:regulator of PEP synthase PpsR (kinase-PPPase family)